MIKKELLLEEFQNKKFYKAKNELRNNEKNGKE